MRTYINAAYFAGGAMVGFCAAWVALEDHFGEKYAEMANANKRAYEVATGIHFEQIIEGVEEYAAKEITDARLMSASIDEEPGPFGGTIIEGGEIQVERKKPDVNPYHTPVEATQIEPVTVEAADAPLSVSYIEEEEYMDEDGRSKLRVDLFMDDTNPVFLLDGEPLHNWDDLLGDSILVDFYQLRPPGSEPILYVRNHRDNVDYEVVRVEP